MGQAIFHNPKSHHIRSATALLIFVTVASFFSLAIHAQSPAPPPSPIAFEVASVNLSASDDCCASFTATYPSARFTAARVPLKLVISLAFGVDSNRISGGPNWLDSQPYDISAKTESDAPLTREQMQPLLRQLLEQRFHLTTHREQKLAPGYALVIARGTPRLQVSKGDPTLINIFPDKVIARTVSVKIFAAILSSPTGRPVVDQTGIQGDYDISLSYATANDAESNLPDLFTALQEQLGLKLQSQKIPVEVLVIDHVDKFPTEN